MAKRSSISPERGGRGGGGGGKRRKSLSNDQSCTVFVGNLDYKTRWQALKDHMRRAGNVDSASILEDKAARRSKGCGIVTYQDPRDASRAIRELNESMLDGRKIFVQPENSPSTATKPTYYTEDNKKSQQGITVHVGNLSFDCTDRNLFDHFKSCGRIRNAEIVVNEHSGKSKGFGKIDFHKPADAQAAISKFNKTDFQGRSIAVKLWASEDETVSIYVGNLSYECQELDLERLFRPFGKFIGAEIIKYNGRSKGYALLDFKARDNAQRAIHKMDETEFQGRSIFVRWDKDSGPQDPPGKSVAGASRSNKKSSASDDLPSTSVFVGNLDFECRWQDLKDLFKAHGRVEHAEVAENPVTKRSKGFGIVTFLTSEQAQRAIDKVDGTEFQNRTIQVKWDKKGAPAEDQAQRGSKRSATPKPAPKRERKPAPEMPAPTLDGALSASR